MDKKQSISVNQPKRTGIVLNRMYTGSYLSSNLGHEVINMFQADNGKHYLYLNARGNFAKTKGQAISDMLLVRYVGENKLEILAWASELIPAPGANQSYIQFGLHNGIRNSQGYIISSEERKGMTAEDFPANTFANWHEEELGDISYGKAGLIKIFEGSEQQNIYITYRAGRFRTPSKGERLFLEFVNDTDFYEPDISETGQLVDNTFYFSGYLLGKTTLHQFILDNDSYKIDKKAWESLCKELQKIRQSGSLVQTHKKYRKLKALLEVPGYNGMSNDELKLYVEGEIDKRRNNSCTLLYNWLDGKKWEETAKKVSEEDLNDYKSREKSLFDIVPKLQRDENCFSDVLRHFMDSHKDEWQEILKKMCSDDNIGAILSIDREKDATIGKTKKGNNSDSNGGRIDLLIRTENAYIVIENKIKSDINSKKDDNANVTQLDRYRAYVNYRIIGSYIEALDGKDEINEIKEEYDKIKPSDWEGCADKWKSDFEVKLSGIYKQLGENWNDIKAYFFILAPDYNMPSKEERKGYLPLYYSTLVGKDKTEMVEDTAENVGDYPYLQEVAEEMRRYHENQAKDNLWMPFYDAMMRHSYNCENESLYEDMKNTFFARIQKCPKVNVSSNLDQNA